MQLRPHRIINRKKTREIKVGKVSVGGNSQGVDDGPRYFYGNKKTYTASATSKV